MVDDRFFDGKQWRYVGGSHTKTEADKKARKERENGNNARVIKNKKLTKTGKNFYRYNVYKSKSKR